MTRRWDNVNEGKEKYMYRCRSKRQRRRLLYKQETSLSNSDRQLDELTHVLRLFSKLHVADAGAWHRHTKSTPPILSYQDGDPPQAWCIETRTRLLRFSLPICLMKYSVMQGLKMVRRVFRLKSHLILHTSATGRNAC